MARIDRGFGTQLVDEIIVHDVNDHMGSVFEDMARSFATELVSRGELNALDIGSWWSSDGQHEIDIVGMARRAPSFIGTVKWRQSLLGWDVYKNLADHARALGVTDAIPWLMIGRGETEAQVRERAPHVRAYSVDDMYAGGTPGRADEPRA